MPILERLTTFVLHSFYLADPKQLTLDASLLELGLIDSTGVLEIVSFLESEFGISVSEDDIVPDNFASLRRISAYVEAKRNGLAKTA